MESLTEHISPDGLLRFVTSHDDIDVSLGFAGFEWHTHADLLVDFYGPSQEIAVATFVTNLLDDRLVIAVSTLKGVVQDVWITDDPVSDLRHTTKEEQIKFRYWSGRSWQAS